MKDEGVNNESHECALRPCTCQVSVIRIVLCSAIPYRNQRVERLMFRRQHKEKLGWNNTSVQPNTIASLPGVDM